MVKENCQMVSQKTQILQKKIERNKSLEKIIYDNGVRVLL